MSAEEQQFQIKIDYINEINLIFNVEKNAIHAFSKKVIYNILTIFCNFFSYSCEIHQILIDGIYLLPIYNAITDESIQEYICSNPCQITCVSMSPLSDDLPALKPSPKSFFLSILKNNVIKQLESEISIPCQFYDVNLDSFKFYFTLQRDLTDKQTAQRNFVLQSEENDINDEFNPNPDNRSGHTLPFPLANCNSQGVLLPITASKTLISSCASDLKHIAQQESFIIHPTEQPLDLQTKHLESFPCDVSKSVNSPRNSSAPSSSTHSSPQTPQSSKTIYIHDSSLDDTRSHTADSTVQNVVTNKELGEMEEEVYSFDKCSTKPKVVFDHRYYQCYGTVKAKGPASPIKGGLAPLWSSMATDEEEDSSYEKFCVRSMSTGRFFLVKRIPRSNRKSQLWELVREKYYLMRLRLYSTWVESFLFSTVDEEFIYFVYDYTACSSLQWYRLTNGTAVNTVLDNHNTVLRFVLPEHTAKYFTAQILLSLLDFRCIGIKKRNLTEKTILLTNNNCAIKHTQFDTVDDPFNYSAYKTQLKINYNNQKYCCHQPSSTISQTVDELIQKSYPHFHKYHARYNKILDSVNAALRASSTVVNTSLIHPYNNSLSCVTSFFKPKLIASNDAPEEARHYSNNVLPYVSLSRNIFSRVESKRQRDDGAHGKKPPTSSGSNNYIPILKNSLLTNMRGDAVNSLINTAINDTILSPFVAKHSAQNISHPHLPLLNLNTNLHPSAEVGKVKSPLTLSNAIDTISSFSRSLVSNFLQNEPSSHSPQHYVQNNMRVIPSLETLVSMNKDPSKKFLSHERRISSPERRIPIPHNLDSPLKHQQYLGEKNEMHSFKKNSPNLLLLLSPPKKNYKLPNDDVGFEIPVAISPVSLSSMSDFPSPRSFHSFEHDTQEKQNWDEQHFFDVGSKDEWEEGDHNSHLNHNPAYSAHVLSTENDIKHLKYPFSVKAQLSGDLWRVGKIVYRMLYGVSPDRNIKGDAIQKLRTYLRGIPDTSPIAGYLRDHQGTSVSVSANARSFLREILNPSPEKRISLEDALCHPWLEDINWQLVMSSNFVTNPDIHTHDKTSMLNVVVSPMMQNKHYLNTCMPPPKNFSSSPTPLDNLALHRTMKTQGTTISSNKNSPYSLSKDFSINTSILESLFSPSQDGEGDMDIGGLESALPSISNLLAFLDDEMDETSCEITPLFPCIPPGFGIRADQTIGPMYLNYVKHLM